MRMAQMVLSEGLGNELKLFLATSQQPESG